MIEHPEETPDAEAQESATLPLSIVGAQPLKEGDVVKLKVLGVDSEAGTFDVAYEHAPKPKGIEHMASAFDSAPPEE